MRNPSTARLVALFICGLSVPAFGEGKAFTLYEASGWYYNGFFGQAVANAGDVNGDGRPDFVISEPWQGRLFVFSGADGRMLYEKNNGLEARTSFGLSLSSVGDLNADGRSDFIVGAPGCDSVYVFSGANGSPIFRIGSTLPFLGFGMSVAGGTDLDGDGVGDFLIGAPSTVTGAVFLHSGKTGTLLRQINGRPNLTDFGKHLAIIGDVDTDGTADFAVGAPSASLDTLVNAGAVFVYSGSTGDFLFEKNGASSDALFGESVAAAGDVDVDGISDFIVGAPLGFPRNLLEPGSAFLYSGATGNLIQQITGLTAENEFGASVAGIGDVNGDGYADVAVGAPMVFFVKAGSMLVYSGKTGSLLTQINGYSDGYTTGMGLGAAMAGLGDVNGDAKLDFLVGDPSYGDEENMGIAYVYSYCNARGDLDGDDRSTLKDVVLFIDCTFLGLPGPGVCHLCQSDLNCDGLLTGSDVVLELNYVFLNRPLPCGP